MSFQTEKSERLKSGLSIDEPDAVQNLKEQIVFRPIFALLRHKQR